MIHKAIEIRALLKSDDRSSFRSGNIDLDRFVTISSGEMATEALQSAIKRRLPDYPLPVLRMVRLAVDEKFRGTGLGKRLLKTVLILALDMRERYGCVGVVVDAKPEAVGFYNSFGFIGLELISGELGDRPQPVPMFLPVASIEKAANGNKGVSP